MSNPTDPMQSKRTIPVEHLVPFDWSSQADELGDSLQEAAQIHLGATAFSSGAADAGSSDYVFKVDGAGLLSHLLLQPRKHELHISVVGAPESAEEVERWTQVVRDALELLRRQRIPWPWAAIIAPAGTSSDPGPCLARLAEVGGVTVRPASRAIRRWPRPIPWGPMRPIANAWPAIVEGVDWTHDLMKSQRAQHRVRRQLHRLCALLTVVFDGVPWRLEWEPAFAPPGYLDVSDALLDADAPDLPFTQRTIETPSWIGAAWRALDGDRACDQALALYYEGAQLRAAHPSMALIAFVGSIESLARAQMERCESCGQVKGNTKRFRNALAEIMADHEAKELGRLYASRSSTAHAGALFGFETTFNAWDSNHFIPREGPLDFTMRLTYEAQHAAGLLLVRRFEDATATSLDTGGG